MKLNPNGTLSVPAARLTTEQLDQHIRDLALQRTLMAPQVQMELPDGEFDVVLFHDVTAVAVTKTSTGAAVLKLRHPGVGWMFFRFDEYTANAVARSMHRTVDGRPGEEIGGSGFH